LLKASILVAIYTPMSLRSWGERVYFEIVEKENRTELIIQSFAPGAVISWGKNNENIERLVHNIEDSFTI
jgi:ribosomal protein S3